MAEKSFSHDEVTLNIQIEQNNTFHGVTFIMPRIYGFFKNDHVSNRFSLLRKLRKKFLFIFEG